MRSSLLVAGVLSLLISAAPAPAVAQEATPSPGAPATVTVTRADDGRTVHLVPTQELLVHLEAPQGEQWQGPSTTGPLYLVAYAEGAERTTARLEALRSQSEPVVLRARTDRACFHDDQPCAQSFTEWSLTVVVDPGPAADGAYDCPARATASPAPGVTYLDETSSGSRVQVPVGRRIHVWLRSCTDHYTVPTAGSGPLWRERAGSGANGYAAATFLALRTGTTSLTASTDPSCFHMEWPCARPSMAWSVEVEVVPASPPEEPCSVPLRLEPETTTLTATGRVAVLVRGTPNAPVAVLAYTRPSTTFRVVRTGTLAADGTLPLELAPPRNTRLYVRQERCADSPHVVLNVRTALTLAAERLGPRQYLFSGDSLPARPGGLVVSLYRITADGREVLTAQARADAQDGTWQVLRTFTGTGRFGFVARTGQDLQNAPGRSGVRSLLVF